MSKYFLYSIPLVLLLVGVYFFLRPAKESPLEQPLKKQRVCLNMIVKDESKVIQRCLDSVLPHIDYWVIVDTGSKDKTPQIIQQHLKGIPGKLYHRPWKNFEHNRNEALQLAKSQLGQDNNDYILFMDADDVLEFESKAEFPSLTKDLYHMWRGCKGYTTTYVKPQMVKADLPWKWVGVTHEYLDCDEFYSADILSNVRYVTKDDGASSVDPKKYHKNVELLENALKTDPNNHRHVFYLAESYRAIGDKGKALEWYQKRVKMEGFAEEVYLSLLQIGHHLRYLGLSSGLVIEAYKQAHAFRPHRSESIHYLADVYNEEKRYQEAYDCIKNHNLVSKPAHKDLLFNQDWIDEFGLLFQLSICSYYLGHYQESYEACQKLLSMENLPANLRRLTVFNKTFSEEKLQVAAKNKKTHPLR